MVSLSWSKPEQPSRWRLFRPQPLLLLLRQRQRKEFANIESTVAHERGERRGVEQVYRFESNDVLLVPHLVSDGPVYQICRVNGAPKPNMAGLWRTRKTVYLRGDRVDTLIFTWCKYEVEAGAGGLRRGAGL